ncbi:hypothetical protein JRQ81_011611 [Phrynocephalus forsythii]|uniref:Phospholipase A2 inhibitor and Ly6/PLAUR domain-containing protein-like n=1 Tax=Phrynocephalus forsythii TaxID=171643 RepID=A0A9Q0X691_9SAUR|nr:hypothetical protein JRQ81_011611 [Phrynocephalus forsythii]
MSFQGPCVEESDSLWKEFPIVMQALLTFSMYFVLIRTGNPIVCEICFGNRTVCEGTRSRCPFTKSICAVRYSEHNLDGKVEQSIEKYCEHPSNCEHNEILLNFGQGKFYRSHLVCCGEENCPQYTPDLLPVDTTPNGKRCPGCFAWSNTCEAEIVNCTGSNLHCFNANSHLTIGGQHMYSVLKGCSSRSFCLLLKSKSEFFTGNFKKANCSPQVSQATRSISFPLQSFFGLIMLKTFS